MDKYIRNIYKGVYTILVGMRITMRQFFEPNVTHQYPYQHEFEKKQNVREIPKGYRGQLYNRIEDCIGCKKCELICPVDCITITGDKLPKGKQLWDSMNVVHLKDGREIIGIIEGNDKKIMSENVMTITNITTRLGPQEVTDRLEPSRNDSRTESIAVDEVSRVVTRNPVVFYLEQFDIDMSICMYCGLCTEVCPTQCLVMKDSLDGIEYSSFDRTDLTFHFDKQEMYTKDDAENTDNY